MCLWDGWGQALGTHGSKARCLVTLKRGEPMETYDAHKTDTEARQGSHTHANLRVMLISLAIVIAAFLVIYFVFFATTPPSVIS